MQGHHITLHGLFQRYKLLIVLFPVRSWRIAKTHIESEAVKLAGQFTANIADTHDANAELGPV